MDVKGIELEEGVTLGFGEIPDVIRRMTADWKESPNNAAAAAANSSDVGTFAGNSSATAHRSQQLSSPDVAVQSPAEWWNTAVRHAYAWEQELFQTDLPVSARAILRAQLPFAEEDWPLYDVDLSIDTCAQALVLLLQPWDDATITRHKEAQTDVEEQIAAFTRRVNDIVALFEKEERTSAPLVAQKIGNLRRCMKLAHDSHAKRFGGQFHKALQAKQVLIVETAMRIRTFMLDLNNSKLQENASIYRKKIAELDAKLAPGGSDLANRCKSLFADWTIIQKEYQTLMKSLGINPNDSSVCNAARIMLDAHPVSFDNITPADLQNRISILSEFAMQTKRMVEAEQKPDNFLCLLKEKKDQHNKELKDASDTRKLELQQSIGRIDTLVRRYDQSPSDSHNHWIIAITRLDEKCRKLHAEWNEVHGRRHKYAMVVEGEMKKAVAAVHDREMKTYASYIADLNRDWAKWEAEILAAAEAHKQKVDSELGIAWQKLKAADAAVQQLPKYGEEAAPRLNEFYSIQTTLARWYTTQANYAQFFDHHAAILKLWDDLYKRTAHFHKQQ